MSMKEKLLELLGVEPLVLLTLLALVSLFIYKVFMKNVNDDRHRSLTRLFKALFATYLTFIFFWAIQYFISTNEVALFNRFYNYFGLATVALGALFFVRIIEIMVFQYLFLKSMKAGVPVLLVNLVTLILSLFIVAWLSTSVLGVRWAPLLATSAIVSVVLGLALQDTLGNLFAGVALQFDKPYEIGDWIEIHGDKSYAGEVHEISWRATVLYGFFDEVITLPNRLVSQSEISNFSAREKPIYRGLSVYLDASANEEQVKAIFVEVLKQTTGVLQHLSHYVMLRELTEKGVHWRLFYPIVHYGQQYTIVDEILMRSQSEFKKAGVQIAKLRVDAEARASER